MRIENKQNKYNPQFKNGFLNATASLDQNVVLSRAIIDMAGCDIPWIIMANNKQERKEKARRMGAAFLIAWISPIITLPLSNRFAMRYISKMSNKFWSNSHKAIHLSNEFLVNADKTKEGLTKLAQKTIKSPFEILYEKISGKKVSTKLDVDALLKKSGGDWETFRKKLIRTKNAVFVSDVIFSFGTIGSFPFINNELTKKEAGQTGFSAELEMADKTVIEKRALEYEKNKKKKYAAFAGIVTAAAAALSILTYGALISKNTGKFINKLKNNAKLFDYKDGIYMSRLPLAIGASTAITGYMLAARNKTERKDTAIRIGISDIIFFGGDLLLASLFSNTSDRIFKTSLKADGMENIKGWRKIFPKVKPLKTVFEEVKKGNLSAKNKYIGAGIFWTNLALIAVSMGYFIPKFVNKMIRSDVKKDAEANTTAPLKTYKMDDFLSSVV